MNLNKYQLISRKDHLSFEFFSTSPKGTLRKVIYFQVIDGNQYNLAFGDWNEAEQRIDDKARSNNNDRDQVIATVGSAVIEFLKYYPDAEVIAIGSTPARTRLYQMGIFANCMRSAAW